jgi:hypothetical protein
MTEKEIQIEKLKERHAQIIADLMNPALDLDNQTTCMLNHASRIRKKIQELQK